MSALTDGYHPVPPGKLAAVVTCLEMRKAPALRAEVNGSWQLKRAEAPSAEWYKKLFARLGSDWLWFSRLRMNARELLAIIQDPRVHIFTLDVDGRDEGILELDFREPGVCELAFFALSPALQGRGAGRWLMNRAISYAWAQPIRRMWVHTCSFDHPDALGFYERSGFTAYARQLEVADDPRLTGALPRESAPQIPIL